MRKVNRKRSAGCVHKTQGFTFVELMIAMALGVTLIGGLVTVFQGNKQSSKLNTAMAEMQENARFAFDTLARDARMAGFQGCIDINTASATILAEGAPTNNFWRSALTGSIVGTTDWDPAPPITFQMPGSGITPVQGSDALSLQFGNQEVFGITPMANGSSDIVLTSATDSIEPGDLIIISNCQVADLVKISAVNDATLKHAASVNQGSSDVSAPYGQGGAFNLASVSKFEANVYFLANTGRLSQSGDEITSLYRQTLPFDNPPQEMIEGVEHFRVKYGVRDEVTGGLTWGSADELSGDFTSVQSLQIGLLMESYDRLLKSNDAKSYYVAGDIIVPEGSSAASAGMTHAGDRRFRLGFNTTINIRNRR